MRRSIICLTIGAPLALVAAAAGAAAAVPTIRHMVWAVWNVPDRLPALPDNGQVHYQPGADRYARMVSALLPSAIARVEAVHGRPFARPATVGVYATPEAYVAANGAGSMGPVGTTFLGRVNLSPVLYSRQPQRLRGILTHELSHAHLQGWMANAYVYLPNWFKEGLAVMVSGGGGAELVSEQEARAAIQRGEHIAIEDIGSLRNLSQVRFERPPPQGAPWHATVLAYRQAGLFVTFLHDSDEPAFARMMNAILDGRPFAEAVMLAYHEDVQHLWQRFAQISAEPR
jgi:hypothetical protein